jgi:HlyD family secretion protein
MSQTSSTSPAIPPGTTDKPAAEKYGAPDKSIFRKAALERLSSPEQLDKLMSITSPAAWLAITAFAILSILILLWGLFGNVADKVTGRGILIRGGAVFDISAGAEGFVSQILVKPGDHVEPNQIIATVVQSDLELKIQLEQNKLKDLVAQDADIAAREDKNNEAQLKAQATERVSRETMVTDLTAQAESLTAQVHSQEELQQKGLVTQAAVLQARNNLYSVQSQLSQSEVRLQEIIAEAIKMARETQEQRNQRKKEIDESSRQLKEYQTQREWTTKIRSPYRGQVIEKLVERGNPVTGKDRIVTVETEEGTMQAVIYIPAGDGKKVRPGMEIQVSPSTVKPEEYGFIIGRVDSVSLFPSTPNGMQRVLRNEQLAKELSQSGAPIEVAAELLKDSHTVSGYKWSSPQGPPISVFSGTLCNGNIVVGNKRPVEYVIPKIKETVGLQ